METNNDMIHPAARHPWKIVSWRAGEGHCSLIGIVGVGFADMPGSIVLVLVRRVLSTHGGSCRVGGC